MTTKPIILTPEEIQQYRDQFKDYPEALDALNTIEEFDYSLDNAAEIIAIETGFEQETLAPTDPDFNYLDKILEKFRDIICSKYTDDTLELFKELKDLIPFPGSLIAVIAIKIGQITIREFCNRN